MQQALLEERVTVNSQRVTEGNCMIKYGVSTATTSRS